MWLPEKHLKKDMLYSLGIRYWDVDVTPRPGQSSRISGECKIIYKIRQQREGGSPG